LDLELEAASDGASFAHPICPSTDQDSRQTYKAYVGLSIPDIISNDWSNLGPREFLLSGFVASLAGSVSRYVRSVMTEKGLLGRRYSSQWLDIRTSSSIAEVVRAAA
jgi:hypothetical protein